MNHRQMIPLDSVGYLCEHQDPLNRLGQEGPSDACIQEPSLYRYPLHLQHHLQAF